MKVRDVVQRLVDVGLEETEAAAYVELYRSGPVGASELARAIGAKRAEGYRVLERLVKRGLVTQRLGRPMLFEAVPAPRAFERLRAAADERQRAIERAAEDLAPVLATLSQGARPGPARNTFRILQGRREIYRTVLRMFEEARWEVKELNVHPAGLALDASAGAWDALISRAKAGVAVRTLLHADPQDAERAREARNVPTMKIRHLPSGQAMRFVVVDGKELVIWVVSDPSPRLSAEGDVAIWSDAPGFVSTQSTLFESLWADGKEMQP
ncbi:MAG: TrmB family transcriptional regulator [Methanobacteriota archaeon]